MRTKQLVIVGGSVVTVAVMTLLGCLLWNYIGEKTPGTGTTVAKLSERTYAERTGSFFTAVPVDPYQQPVITELTLPDISGGNAFWGASGRDDRGHVWFGLSVHDEPSAHLLEFIPGTGQLIDQGSVVSQLKQTDVYRTGERQQKIHSRIIQADDGYLYFSSMDEAGEQADGSQLPTWGSHLWRINPLNHHWEHLQSVPQGLIAVSGVGRWIYALGYWDHILFQFDTQTKKIRSIRVGSVGGHISRNFLTNVRGHAFVPRLRLWRDGVVQPKSVQWQHDDIVITTLVEFDNELRDIAETPLLYYIDNFETPEKPRRYQGIVGFSYLADSSMVFLTSLGYLYQIVPTATGPARVVERGWFHPQGRAAASSLFTYAGKRYLMGVTKRRDSGREWVVYDLENDTSAAIEFPFPAKRHLHLYGSITRDAAGYYYLVGRHQKPVILKVSVPSR